MSKTKRVYNWDTLYKAKTLIEGLNYSAKNSKRGVEQSSKKLQRGFGLLSKNSEREVELLSVVQITCEIPLWLISF